MLIRRVLIVVALLVLVAVSGAIGVFAANWPYWRAIIL